MRVNTSTKAIVVDLTNVTGVGTAHTLFLPQTTEGGVRVCLNATEITQVTRDCTPAVTFTYQEALNGLTRDGIIISLQNGEWRLDNVTGTGVLELNKSATDGRDNPLPPVFRVGPKPQTSPEPPPQSEPENTSAPAAQSRPEIEEPTLIVEKPVESAPNYQLPRIIYLLLALIHAIVLLIFVSLFPKFS